MIDISVHNCLRVEARALSSGIAHWVELTFVPAQLGFAAEKITIFFRSAAMAEAFSRAVSASMVEDTTQGS